VLGLYLHIPFCASICHYCNFNRGLLDESLKARYVDALEQEIRRSADGSAADTIFFGGGTPSLLSPDEVRRLVFVCRNSFDVQPDAEVTLEANPETVTSDRLAAYREAGVTRLSFGVQSLDDGELARLGRLHGSARARDAVAEARQAGYDNVSVDLMMWLPDQTLRDWQTTVDGAIGLEPDHLSLYLLELYPNAPLQEAMLRSRWTLASDDDAADMYEWGMQRLEERGFRQYEISNVARPGRESRHNLKYWNDGAWLGFGCGAHSTRGALRWKNVAPTGEYIRRIAAGSDLAVEKRTRSWDERLGDALFTGLRLFAGLDLDAIAVRYGVDVWERYRDTLQPHVEAGHLVREGSRLRLTRPGMLVANEIMAVFV
jgi:oxygen-independent coproporphyrinogen III oxidase